MNYPPEIQKIKNKLLKDVASAFDKHVNSALAVAGNNGLVRGEPELPKHMQRELHIRQMEHDFEELDKKGLLFRKNKKRSAAT